MAKSAVLINHEQDECASSRKRDVEERRERRDGS